MTGKWRVAPDDIGISRTEDDLDVKWITHSMDAHRTLYGCGGSWPGVMWEKADAMWMSLK